MNIEYNIKNTSELWFSNNKHLLKQSTFCKYKNIIQNHIIPDIGLLTIDSIRTEDINKYIQKKLVSGKIDKSGGLSPKSVKDIISVLKLILKYAEVIGIKNACNFDAISIKSECTEMRVLEKGEIQKLTAELINETDYVKLGILISLYTGLRIGEICALKFSDVSIKDNIVHINKTMQRVQNFSGNNGAKTNIIITSPKSKSSIREIPCPDFIIKLIKDNNMYVSNGYVLTGRFDKFTEPRTLENKFKKILYSCSMQNRNFHTLRHTFATCCVEAGVEIKSLSEILGHSSVNITLNKYVHSTMELKRTCIKKLESYISL